jgi:hypothetical protein
VDDNNIYMQSLINQKQLEKFYVARQKEIPKIMVNNTIDCQPINLSELIK